MQLSQIQEYYGNLIIAQYRDKPKAIAMINGLTSILQSNNIYLDILDAYNLETAVGKQLEVIGKYVGVNNKYFGVNLQDGTYLSFGIGLQDETVDRKGYQVDLIDGAIINNSSFDSGNDILNDEQYRFVIKMQIVCNNTDNSAMQVDELLQTFFPDNEVVASSNDEMDIYYWINSSLSELGIIAYRKGVLPKPMGVRLKTLIKSDIPFVGFGIGLQDESTFFKGYQSDLKDGKFFDSSDLLILSI